MWLELRVVDRAGRVLAASGVLDSPASDLCDGDLLQLDGALRGFVLGCNVVDSELVNLQQRLVDKIEVAQDAAGAALKDRRGEPVLRAAPGAREVIVQHFTSGPVARHRSRSQVPVPPPGVVRAVETDRPVRPWELPRDTIPEVDPEADAKKKGEPAPRTAASVARAPLPDQASGVARGESRPTSEKLKFVPRALLFVPRIAVEVAGAPIGGSLYVYDRFEVAARARDIFCNDAGTVGL
jgi:hypothetical protein